MSYNDTLKDNYKEGIDLYFARLEIMNDLTDPFDRSTLKAKIFMQGLENQKTDSLIKRPMKEAGEMTVQTFKNTFIR